MPAGFGGLAAGAAPGDLQKEVDKWSMLSMVTFFFGCGILALVPIMMSNSAKEALRRGDTATAQSKLKTAKLLCILGFVNVAFWIVISIIYVIVAVVLSAM